MITGFYACPCGDLFMRADIEGVRPRPGCYDIIIEVMNDLTAELKNIIGDGQILKGEPMSSHTSFQAGGSADYFLVPGTEESMIGAIRALREGGTPFFLLGNGSNLLVRDGGYRGAMISTTAALNNIDVSGDVITAGAGASLSAVANRAAENGLSGMEFAGGIPGSVGGALFMNAGAYGGEMSDIVESARVFHIEGGRVVTIERDGMGLGYRESAFQSGFAAILSVRLRLKEGDSGEIHSKMRDLGRRRNEKQPMQLPSAGSFFKRPEGHFAGRLIEDAGLKGLQVGGARVSEKHAGFIVNAGGATASDIINLMKQVQERVFARSGVRLNPEPLIIGDDPK